MVLCWFINRKQEGILHLSMLDPKKLWRRIINCIAKENNMIPLKECNSYLKSLYEFPNTMDTILDVPIENAFFFYGRHKV
jgi:hypothetical protein